MTATDAMRIRLRRRRASLCIAALAVSAMGYLPDKLSAGTYLYVGGSNWNNAANWIPAQVPGDGDSALINNNGSFSLDLTYDAPYTTENLQSLVISTSGSGSATVSM